MPSLNDIRSAFPEYKGLSDAFVFSDFHQRYAPDQDQYELAQKLGYELPGSDFGRGATDALTQTKQAAQGVGAATGALGETVFGEGGLSTTLKTKSLEGMAATAADLQKEAKPSDSFTYSFEKLQQGDLSPMTDWAQYASGQALSQGLLAMASAGVGGLGLRAAMPALSKRLVEAETQRLAASAAGQSMTQEAIANLARQKVGDKFGAVALGTYALGQEGGEIGGDVARKATEEGRSVTEDEHLNAMANALAAGGLEFVQDKFGLDLVQGKFKPFGFAKDLPGAKGLLARGAAYGAAAAPFEGATEYGQTLLEEQGKGNDPFSPESLQGAKDAAALGAVGGGLMGGAGGLLSKPASQPLPDISPILQAGSVDEAIAAANETVKGANKGANKGPNKGAKDPIHELIRGAAFKHGVSEAGLLKMAEIESAFDPSARNKSGAAGLFQFMPGTAKQYGLANPFDAGASADAAARLMKDNAAYLFKHLGRSPTDGELYLAHQQGAGGAAKLLSHPEQLAKDVVGLQAVIQNGGTADMTAGQFAALWTQKVDAAKGIEAKAAPVITPSFGLNNEQENRAGSGNIASEPGEPGLAPREPGAEGDAGRGGPGGNDGGLGETAPEPQKPAGLLSGASGGVEQPLSPTHEASDGQPLWQVEGNVYRDQDGNEVVDDYASPIAPPATAAPAPTTAEVDAAASETATSKSNDKPQPTEGQKKAGNYEMGHIKNYHGLDITIENDKGSERSGTDKDGKPWSITMANHYGYVKRSKDNTGEHVDVFLGDQHESRKVYVIKQLDPKTKAFDEPKVMLGFNTPEEAKAAYHANYEKDWKGFGGMVELSIEDFKDRLSKGTFRMKSAPKVPQDVPRETSPPDGLLNAPATATPAPAAPAPAAPAPAAPAPAAPAPAAPAPAAPAPAKAPDKLEQLKNLIDKHVTDFYGNVAYNEVPEQENAWAERFAADMAGLDKAPGSKQKYLALANRLIKTRDSEGGYRHLTVKHIPGQPEMVALAEKLSAQAPDVSPPSTQEPPSVDKTPKDEHVPEDEIKKPENGDTSEPAAKPPGKQPSNKKAAPDKAPVKKTAEKEVSDEIKTGADPDLVQRYVDKFRAGNYKIEKNAYAVGYAGAKEANESHNQRHEAAYDQAVIQFLSSDLSKLKSPKAHEGLEVTNKADGAVTPFPFLPAVLAKKVGSDFKSLAKSLLSHAAKQDVRYYLNGILIRDGELIVSDGHRLAILKASPEDTPVHPVLGSVKESTRSLILNRAALENKLKPGQDEWLDARYPDFTKVMQVPRGKPVALDVMKLMARANAQVKASSFVDSKSIKDVAPMNISEGLASDKNLSAQFNSHYILDAAKLFRQHGYEKVNASLGESSGGPLHLESPDGKLTVVVMAFRANAAYKAIPFKTFDFKQEGTDANSNTTNRTAELQRPDAQAGQSDQTGQEAQTEAEAIVIKGANGEVAVADSAELLKNYAAARQQLEAFIECMKA